MAEVITEDLPRVKFTTTRQGSCSLPPDTPDLQALAALMARMEALGAAPLLADGAVGGNCGILVDLPGAECPALFVSRTGKPPGLHLSAADFVQVVRFDKEAWAADFRSHDPQHRPTSDTPLLQACLSSISQARHHWSQQPRVAFHGHALAEGEGLAEARRLGLPISEQATLFSTPPDLQQLEHLLMAHPYPQERCFIRRGHGFFILAGSAAEAETVFEDKVAPFLARQQQQQQQQEQQQQQGHKLEGRHALGRATVLHARHRGVHSLYG
ncbi:hypothetical protein OEZ86_012376 [Tetradesmus obliquus]|nr:hypothetical protein OEZ86_012376 [Tetradesmus obliquus]